MLLYVKFSEDFTFIRRDTFSPGSVLACGVVFRLDMRASPTHVIGSRGSQGNILSIDLMHGI